MPDLIMKFREKRYILMIRVNDHRCLIAEREKRPWQYKRSVSPSTAEASPAHRKNADSLANL